MTKWKLSNLIIALVLLFFYPFVLNVLLNGEYNRQKERNADLVRRYECIPSNNCQADFNGDGKIERVEIGDYAPRRFEWCIYVSETGRDIFELPYSNVDNTLRTHIAINWEKEKPHLLIYDKTSNIKTVSAFAWNGNKLSEIQPTNLDKEILSAMAFYDDTGGWRERGFRELKIRLGFFAYHTFYVVMVAWIFYKRRQQAKLNLP